MPQYMLIMRGTDESNAAMMANEVRRVPGADEVPQGTESNGQI